MIKCNLSVLLAERNMRISELSKRTGISRTTLTALAYNQSKGIQYDTFDKLCTFLKVKPDELFIHEFFDYDFEIEAHIGNPFHPIEPTDLELVCDAKIIYKDILKTAKIPISTRAIIESGEMESILLIPHFGDELEDFLAQIPVTFITNMNEEIIDAARAYLTNVFGTKENIEFLIK